MSGCPENEWGHGATERRREAKREYKETLDLYIKTWLEYTPEERKEVCDYLEKHYLNLRMRSPMRSPRPSRALIYETTANLLRHLEKKP